MAAQIIVDDYPNRPQHAARQRCSDGQHAVRNMGTMRGRGPARLDCDQPLLRVCVRAGCYWQEYLPCKQSRRSVCRPCSIRYRRRIADVIASGLGHREGGFEYFGTLTSIGDVVHCKRAHCDRAPYCSHEICPCTKEDSPDLATWNASHSRRWNHFMTVLRRRYPGIKFLRGVEPQDGKRRTSGPGRLALHDHFLLWSPVPISGREIRDLAITAGFGHASGGKRGWVPVMPGSRREVYYVSKYITKASDQRAQVPWRADVLDTVTGELLEGQVVAGRYRTWSTSRNWGLTLGQARAAAHDRYLLWRAERDIIEFGIEAMRLSAELGLEIVPDESPPLPSR